MISAVNMEIESADRKRNLIRVPIKSAKDRTKTLKSTGQISGEEIQSLIQSSSWNSFMASKRILNELKDHHKKPSTSFGAAPLDADIFHWTAAILGPPDSPYDGGVFLLTFDFPPDYPLKPPVVAFKTKVFHPIVDCNGRVHLDILNKKNWLPGRTISEVLLSIYSLLKDPNPEIAHICKSNRTKFENIARSRSPIHSLLKELNPVGHYSVPEIAHMYKTNMTKFETIARSWTQKYAMD